MTITYRKAALEDAELLIELYNAAFYSDFVRYGACPGYGKTKGQMEKSIRRYLKHIILSDNVPVGCVSCYKMDAGAMRSAACALFRRFKEWGSRQRQFSL